MENEIQRLQSINNELVAALEKIAKSDPLSNGRYAAHNAAQALARAESATAAVVKDSLTTESGTPAKHPDTEIVDWLEVDPQARLAEVRRLIFIDRDTVREAVHAARKQGGEK